MGSSYRHVGSNSGALADPYCSNLKYTGWANFVDVDVHGTWDDSLKLAKYSNVYCRVL